MYNTRRGFNELLDWPTLADDPPAEHLLGILTLCAGLCRCPRTTRGGGTESPSPPAYQRRPHCLIRACRADRLTPLNPFRKGIKRFSGVAQKGETNVPTCATIRKPRSSPGGRNSAVELASPFQEKKRLYLCTFHPHSNRFSLGK